jgi:hypothetical protein
MGYCNECYLPHNCQRCDSCEQKYCDECYEQHDCSPTEFLATCRGCGGRHVVDSFTWSLFSCAGCRRFFFCSDCREHVYNSKKEEPVTCCGCTTVAARYHPRDSEVLHFLLEKEGISLDAARELLIQEQVKQGKLQ